MGINIKGVLVGGLTAGAIIILSGVGMVPLVGHEMDLALTRFNLPPLSNGAMAFFAGESVVLGIILVWLYAAVTPRLKPGIWTAVVVSVLVWLLAYFFANAAMVAYGFMPVRITVIGTAWGLVELLLAGVIGTRLYEAR